jgi:FkbM family methyltransferase
MIKYFKESFKRKLARRVTKKYPVTIDDFNVTDLGKVQFANWKNPLVSHKEIDENCLDFFKKFIKKGDLVIDIGANIGHTTVMMSLVAGKEGTTLGFDPNPYVYEILEQNSKLNPELTNIDLYQYAITDHDDEFFYNSSEASFNNGGISKEKVNRHGKHALESKIKGINLENFLSKNYAESIDKLTLIKIDTEGYDKEIIRSISDLLIKYKPTVITECLGKNSDADKFEQYELLISLGYSLYYFSDFIGNAEVVKITKKEDMLNWKHFDLYAIAE